MSPLTLPEAYCLRMQTMLGEDWTAYLASLEEAPVSSLRFNRRKWGPEEAGNRFPAYDRAVPWIPEGRYIPEGMRPARHPAYFAGLYYIQEASAMTPGGLLPLKPGGRTLDLCAAPGGKSTQLASRMAALAPGVLYANDISASRAQALLKNLEMSGIPEIFVTAESPEKLAEQFPGYFDSILVDAPCSGEGMTRRDTAMWKDWLTRGPAYYQPLQAAILDQAAAMAAPGAWLLYSTCTFSEEENEGNIRAFLERHPDFSLVPLLSGGRMAEDVLTDSGIRAGGCTGFAEGPLPGTVRLWPHRVRGEGHFLALLHREGQEAAGEAGLSCAARAAAGNLSPASGSTSSGRKKDLRRKRAASGPVPLPDLSEFRFPWERFTLIRREEKLYALPKGETVRAGLHYLRTGLYVGDVKKNGFQPSQALAMVLDRESFPRTVSFRWEDERAVRYLKGETVDLEEIRGAGGESAAGGSMEIRGGEGLVLVCLEDWPLGWAVRGGNRLKNRYPAGWRWT